MPTQSSLDSLWMRLYAICRPTSEHSERLLQRPTHSKRLSYPYAISGWGGGEGLAEFCGTHHAGVAVRTPVEWSQQEA